jgi:hypothetical protein
MAAVLDSFYHQDDDLSVLVSINLAEVACSRRLCWRSTGHFMPGVCRIGWDSVVRTRVLLFRGNVSKLCWLLIFLIRGTAPASASIDAYGSLY